MNIQSLVLQPMTVNEVVVPKGEMLSIYCFSDSTYHYAVLESAPSNIYNAPNVKKLHPRRSAPVFVDDNEKLFVLGGTDCSCRLLFATGDVADFEFMAWLVEDAEADE